MGNYMYPSTPRKQQGISLSGLLIWSFVLILVSIVGMKLIPVYIENATIKRTLLAVATESNFKTNNEEIRQSLREEQVSTISRRLTDKISLLTKRVTKLY